MKARHKKELDDLLAEIDGHFTKVKDPLTKEVKEPSYPHDPFVHEEEGHDDPEMKFCPTCRILTITKRLRSIHEEL